MKDTSGSSPHKNHYPVLVGYLIGTISTIVIKGLYDWLHLNKSNKIKNNIEQNNSIDRTNAGATIEGNDLSLFYGDEQQLTTIGPKQKFLPNDIYSSLVLNTVVCCVDILLVNTKTKKALLVLRNSEPAKNFWWLPGGRLLKGETFFTAAIRKAKDETGIIDNVQPIQILGIWNTFFPTSNWDTTEQSGTQTVNPIVLVEINNNDTNSLLSTNDTNTTPKIQLDETSTSYRWITVDPKDNTTEDKYVQQALLRLKQWNPSYIQYK